MATIQFTETLVMKVIYCANCNIPFAISEDHQDRMRKTHEGFYCPNGHSNIYNGLNAEEKLRAELKRKEQELADKAIEAIRMQNELESQIKRQKRDLKRLTNGVCPCCNRTFSNLHNHMKKQHPEAIIPNK